MRQHFDFMPVNRFDPIHAAAGLVAFSSGLACCAVWRFSENQSGSDPERQL